MEKILIALIAIGVSVLMLGCSDHDEEKDASFSAKPSVASIELGEYPLVDVSTLEQPTIQIDTAADGEAVVSFACRISNSSVHEIESIEIRGGTNAFLSSSDGEVLGDSVPFSELSLGKRLAPDRRNTRSFSLNVPLSEGVDVDSLLKGLGSTNELNERAIESLVGTEVILQEGEERHSYLLVGRLAD